MTLIGSYTFLTQARQSKNNQTFLVELKKNCQQIFGHSYFVRACFTDPEITYGLTLCFPLGNGIANFSFLQIQLSGERGKVEAFSKLSTYFHGKYILT